MRGHHQRYIDEVNAMMPPWYERKRVGHGKIVTTIDLTFHTVIGDFGVQKGTPSDVFSCVPDTGYFRMHKAAILHDEARKKLPRMVADYLFYSEMHAAIRDIRAALYKTTCPAEVIDREIVRLSRVASAYMLGVSGWIGSAYIWLDRIF